MKPSRLLENPFGSRLAGSVSSSHALARPGFTRADLISCLIVISVATLTMLPIFARGFPNGDDAFVHYRWATEFHEALQEKGVLYPRWLAIASNGQGSPVMLYCPPLPLVVSETFNILVRNTLLALELSCLVGMIASGLTMYVFTRALLSPFPSLLAAVLYMVAPYHIFDLYHRSALSEYWSFAWIPLVFHAISVIAKGTGRRAVVYLAVSFALLIFSHVIMTFAVTLILPIFILLMTRAARRLLEAVTGLALGVGISAAFIAPIIFERDYARVHRALRLKYTNNFQFEELINAVKVRLFVREEVRLYIGEWIDVVALCVLLLFVVSVFVIFVRPRREKSSVVRGGLVCTTLAIAAVSLLMTTRLSSPVWRAIPKLPYMQFPFRWLVIATLGACFLAGVAVSTLPSSYKLRFLYGALITGVVIFNLAMSTLAIARASHDRKPLEEGLSALEVPEYRPIWWDNELHLQETLPSVAVSSGDADVKAIDDLGIDQSYEVDARSVSELKLRQLYFPGWVARLDGRPTDIAPTEDGHLLLTVTPGRQMLTLRFEDTGPRAAGKLVSAASLLISVLILGVSPSRFHRRSRSNGRT